MLGIYGVRCFTGGLTDFVGPSFTIATTVIALVVGLLQRKFPRLPFSVVGVALAGMHDIPWTFFLPWVTAWILKYLSIKVARVEFHSNKGVPLAIGVIVGWALQFFIENLALLALSFPRF